MVDQDREQLRLEGRRLEQTIGNAQAQLEGIRQRAGERAAALSALQEDLWDDSAQVYSMQSFHDMVELSQLNQSLAGDVESQESEAHTQRVLEQMLDAPYFARIDFRFDEEGEGGDQGEAEPIYIGRATLMAPNGLDIDVYDWRAPVASLFYRHGLGAASYKAPGGVIAGVLSLKRQFEIGRGELAYFFDADLQIVDSFLRELLSKTASPTMRAIVETIQRDQDMIIRDMDSEVLMVQGAAGSGKTSVAMHRVAYLMYRGLAGRLSAEELLILSPNAVFERYIAHILPELGERSVRTLLLEEVFRQLLPSARIQPRAEAVEAMLDCADAASRALLRGCVEFKGSEAFVMVLDRLVEELPHRWVAYADIEYDEACIAERGELRDTVLGGKQSAAVGLRLRWLERAILERVRARRRERMEKLVRQVRENPEQAQDAEAIARMLSIQENAELVRRIRAFTEVDCAALYRRLFEDPEAFARLTEGMALPPDIAAMVRMTRVQLSQEVTPFADAAAIAYLQSRVYGCAAFQHVRQVVIDEAQDERPLHFALLREAFPRARFTLLGDVHQAVAQRADPTLYERAGAILAKPRTERVVMGKSFRCTEEIWRYCSRFLPSGDAGECFSRHGEAPAVHAAPDAEAMDTLLLREIEVAVQRGYRSIGLVCKTEREAAALHARLRAHRQIGLVRGDGETDARGVFVIPLYMAKGLEFDAALVCDADAAHYAAQEDKNLLYVACTRALHKLDLFHTGPVSPLIG